MRANPPLPNLVESSCDSHCEQLTVAEQARLCVVTLEKCTEAEVRNESRNELERVAGLIIARLIVMVTATSNPPVAEWRHKTFQDSMEFRLLQALHGRHELKATLIGALGIVVSSRVFYSAMLRFDQLDAAVGGGFDCHRNEGAFEMSDHLQSLVRGSSNPRLQAAWAIAGYLRDGCSLEDLRWSSDRPDVCKRRQHRGNTILLRLDGRVQSISQWSTLIGISESLIHKRLAQGWTHERTLTVPARRKKIVTRRDAVMLTSNGRTQSATAWAKELGVSRSLILKRIAKGWPHERALSVPPGQARELRLLTLNGRTQSVGQWSRELGITENALRHRLSIGWTEYEALTVKKGARRNCITESTDRSLSPSGKGVSDDGS